MNSYTFYTIHTVVDIGDGVSGAIEDGKFTSTMNLSRLVESIMCDSYPMMVSVSRSFVDLTKEENSNYYKLPQTWGKCHVYTFKCTMSDDISIKIDSVPLVVPTIIGEHRLTKFVLYSEENNISITKQTF